MPRLYTHIARQNIWKTGFRSSALNKQGFTVDRSIPAVTSDHEPQDTLLVLKGKEYYTWHPKGSPWQYSLTRPDLRSDWEREFAQLSDMIDELTEDEDNTEYDADEIRSQIEERRDQIQESLDNMPEQLQESSVLNERIEELDNLLDQL